MEREKATSWNPSMKNKTRLEEIFWSVDKRFFRWDRLPAIAKLGFIQKSYILLAVLPLLDQFFSPILSLPAGSKVVFDLGWIYIIPEGLLISFEIGMPFSWKLIYISVLLLALGSAIYEVFVPKLIGRSSDRKVTNQLVLQNFREVALNIFFKRRRNHFLSDFCGQYASNLEDLKTPSEDHIFAAEKEDNVLVGLPKSDSAENVSKHSIYYFAQHIVISENLLEEAIETILWYQNETKLIARWACGIFFLGGVMAFAILIFQGLNRMI